MRNIDVNNVSEQALNQLRAYAIKEAQAATYRDANSLAEGLNRLQRRAETSAGKTVGATGVLIEGVMPFKKMPMNIAKQEVNYSSIGILKGTYELISKVRGGDIQISQIVDSFAKGLTGTGAMLLGCFSPLWECRSANGDGKKPTGIFSSECLKIRFRRGIIRRKK